MSHRLKKHAACLHVLSIANNDMRKAMIKHADSDLVHCLCECAHNILKGNVPLTSGQLAKLKSYRQHLRNLVDKTKTNKKRILQTGGFLPALLAPIAASVLGGLLFSR